MTDLDPIATLRIASRSFVSISTNDYVVLRSDVDAALAALEASRAREARLEALVRSLGKCTVCGGEGYVWQGHDVDSIECDHCAGTGIVEAARKELSDG